MDAVQSVKVQYDATSRRVDLSYGDRRVSLPGEYEDLDEARKAAELYAKRYLIEK